MMLYLLDDAESIDLSEHFAHADEIIYTATVRGSAVDTEVSGSTLTVTPVLTGDSRVTVTAAVGDKSIADSFMVNVKPGSMPVISKVAPTKVKPIQAQMIYQGDGPETIDLSEHFSHENEIMYTAAVRGDAVDASTAGSMLTLDPVLPGSARVTVTATADGKSSNYAFMVTVKAGTEPPPPPSDPPMPEGMIMAQEVEVGASLPVMDVSMYFTPTGLTYTAVSADTSKATATIPTGSSSLTIVGVAIGTATVTVTATDSDGRMTTQAITVTVTAKSAPLKPTTVTIDGVNETTDVSIDLGQTLQPVDGAAVSVSRKIGSATVWTLTGKKKGTTDVRILSADRMIDGIIEVTVKNSKPVIVEANVPSTIQQLAAAATGIAEGNEIVDDKGAVVVVAPGKRGYHKLDVDFSKIFNDLDGDIKTYKAKSAEPYVTVVHETSALVVLDVRKKVGTSFTLNVYVVDEDGEMSEQVQLSVETVIPIKDMYKVEQHIHATSLKVKGGKVYPREGVNHELVFLEYEDSSSGFRFVNEYRTAQTGSINTETVVTNALTTKPTGTVNDSTTPYYGVTNTKNLAMLTFSLDGEGGTSGTDDPKLTFQVTGSGRATVTFTYNAVLGTDASGDGSDDTWAFDKTPPKATVEMNIVS
jgi:hypothetical protein